MMVPAVGMHILPFDASAWEHGTKYYLENLREHSPTPCGRESSSYPAYHFRTHALIRIVWQPYCSLVSHLFNMGHWFRVSKYHSLMAYIFVMSKG